MLQFIHWATRVGYLTFLKAHSTIDRTFPSWPLKYDIRLSKHFPEILFIYLDTLVAHLAYFIICSIVWSHSTYLISTVPTSTWWSIGGSITKLPVCPSSTPSHGTRRKQKAPPLVSGSFPSYPRDETCKPMESERPHRAICASCPVNGTFIGLGIERRKKQRKKLPRKEG